MATIRARKQADGSTRYTPIVRIRKRKIIIHQEYKTFAHRVAAVTRAFARPCALFLRIIGSNSPGRFE